MELEDKVTIVTGGASGIGRAIAKRYREEGAEVAIFDVNEEEGTDVAAELDCTFVRCDVSDREEVAEAIQQVVNEHGGLDILVNNAGIGAATPVDEMDYDEWDSVIDINLTGVMNCSKEAIDHLKSSEGCIINIASIYGLVGGPEAAAYSAAKGGVVNLTRNMGIDYANDGVRVNAICPGFVETAMTDDYLDDESFYEFVKAETPMGRVADPEEIAGAAAFLASEDASYITGAAVPVDGGWTAH